MKAKIIWTVVLIGLGSAVGLAVGFTQSTVKADTITNTIEVPVEMKAPVLDRIAQCESHNKQFLTNGDVVTNTNTNGSVDVGRYQINLSADHIKQMAKLGINPLTDEGNATYAKYLYANVGTSPWSSSSGCWNK